MRDIEVTYDGRYPSACNGTLRVVVDGELVFENAYCRTSIGDVWFSADGEEHIDDGELVWDNADEFPQDVQEAVKRVLAEVGVCCGGCV